MNALTRFYYSLMGRVAYADGFNGNAFSGDKYTGGTGTAFSQIFTYIYAGLDVAGGVIILIGVIQLAISIYTGNQNPETIPNAIKLFIVGGLILGAGVIVGLFMG